MDSSAHTALVDLEIINENLVTADSKIINENCVAFDSEIGSDDEVIFCFTFFFECLHPSSSRFILLYMF